MIRGVYCPMGCGETLTFEEDLDDTPTKVGTIVCSDASCPRPAAAADLLADLESEHIVNLEDEQVYTIRHPLRERLGDAYVLCTLTDWLRGLDGPPQPPGHRYRVVWDGTTAVVWERVDAG